MEITQLFTSGKFRSFVIFAGIAVSIAGCQTDKVDLQDARETAVLLSGQTAQNPAP